MHYISSRPGLLSSAIPNLISLDSHIPLIPLPSPPAPSQVRISFTRGGETMSLKQLSGGQRTLVALALIFAIQVGSSAVDMSNRPTTRKGGLILGAYTVPDRLPGSILDLDPDLNHKGRGCLVHEAHFTFHPPPSLLPALSPLTAM